MAIHVQPNDSEARVAALMRQGAYGYGVSVVRAHDGAWGSSGEPAPVTAVASRSAR